DALAGLDRLDLVKVDIAGMEPRALRGLARTLERLRPVLICEFHPWAIERATGTPALEFLAWLGRRYASMRVLRRAGDSEDVTDAQDVMQAWRAANEVAGMDGRMHLDLLLLPRAAG
ncbi:MAG: FkbM family methyltransferase, partial [Xanthomonadales bacterium]|nr:FkbM family methyltransferase [Xanthomonadales bacterium]